MFWNGAGNVRFSRRLYDALGLGHVLMGVAVSETRTCFRSVLLLLRRRVEAFVRAPTLC
jgi:hypothetical protein